MDKNNKAIILSIKPLYGKKIFSGEKKVELRKRIPKHLYAGGLVLVYLSSPSRCLLGAFTVKKIVKEEHEKLWKMVHKKACIEKIDYDQYFSGTLHGYAIYIDKCWPLTYPITLKQIQSSKSDFVVPQSFRYIKSNEYSLLKLSCAGLI